MKQELEAMLAESENEIRDQDSRTAEIERLTIALASAQSLIVELETGLKERSDKLADLTTQLVALNAQAAKDLAEIATLRKQHEVDQTRISRFNTMFEHYLANELRQKNEQCQLEQRISNLTCELETFKNSFTLRIGRRIENLSRGFRGISGQTKVRTKLQ